MTILLVDDDPTTGAIVSNVLTRDGHTVHVYSSAQEALEGFPDSLDLIISDFYMPGMTGGEFYDRVRTFNRDVPFIYLTSEDNTTVAVELMRRGASDLIQKPIHPDTLRLRIERVMQDARHRREIRRILEEEALVRGENQRLVN
jgi:two-component system, cell cycle response regulator